MSNEKSWRKSTWDITGYESKRFFDPSKSSAKKSDKGGDKMSDTLV